MKLLIDPSPLEGQGLSRRLDDLIQSLAHSYVPFFDNVDEITPGQCGLISKGYGLTELGQARLREVSYTANQSVATSTREPLLLENGLVRSKPIRPDDSIATSGFTWVFDQESWKWVMRRKQNHVPTEFRREPEPIQLFPP